MSGRLHGQGLGSAEVQAAALSADRAAQVTRLRVPGPGYGWDGVNDAAALAAADLGLASFIETDVAAAAMACSGVSVVAGAPLQRRRRLRLDA